MFENLSNKQKYIIAGAILSVIIITYIFFGKNAKDEIMISANNQAVNQQPIEPTTKEELVPIPPVPKDIIVHVSGRIKNSGVIKIKEGSRINDAITTAGGTLNDADLDTLNLAALVRDGDKIYVPKKGEIIPNHIKSSVTLSSSGNSYDTSGPININTASITELDKIPGVGPSTAQKIIDYRQQNGGFKTKEDIKKVKGIGPKTYEKIKEGITN